MSEASAERTSIDSDTDIKHVTVSRATREVYILLNESRAPRVLLTGDGERARVFDLDRVTTDNHGWVDDDGFDNADPSVIVKTGDTLHEVLIRGVAKHMVAIDHAEHREDTPRLLVFTEHTSDDDSPRSFPL